MGIATYQYTVRQITVTGGGGEGVALLCNLNVLVKLNPLTPISNQDRISPYSINTISTR